MRRALLPFAVVISSAFVALWPGEARASDVTEFPDNGSEQMARGGAWFVRASDPLATAFNPAGLAGQRTALTVQANFYIHDSCFTRLKANDDTSQDPLVGADGHFPRVCNDLSPTFNPQIGITYRVNDRLGLGALLIGPASTGERSFPEFVNDGNGTPQATPTRFLFLRQAGVILFPTVGVGWEPIDNLRIGASFSWGIARLNLTTASRSINTDAAQPQGDVRAKLQVEDLFVPGFALGGIWGASPSFEIGAFYKWSDAIRARGDVGTAANYWTKQNAQGDDSSVRYGDTIYKDCGTGQNTTACNDGGNGTFKLQIPMEAKLGARYHKPRNRVLPDGGTAEPEKHLRDPIAQDVFDLEADLTWANNSAIDTVEVRFPGDATGKGALPVAGVPGGELPPNADQIRNYHDVFGVRVGGDYNLLPDQLALRAGAFYETSAANAPYQSLDFAAGWRLGLSLGATYRIKVGHGDKPSAFEIMLGYGHIFVGTLERNDPNADGLRGLAGTSCNASDPIDANTCKDGNPRYRTKWPVNLGTITNTVNVLNVGVAYRF